MAIDGQMETAVVCLVASIRPRSESLIFADADVHRSLTDACEQVLYRLLRRECGLFERKRKIRRKIQNVTYMYSLGMSVVTVFISFSLFLSLYLLRNRDKSVNGMQDG